MPVVNMADVPVREVEDGDVRHARRRLGPAAGAVRVGASRFVVPPGARQMPVHIHGDEDEAFFVLGGSGLSCQKDEACAIGAGDTIVHVANGLPHTLLAGDDGLDLLAFASGSDTHLTYLPRPKVMWAGPRWVPADGPHPFAAEAACGPLERPIPGARPANVVAFADVAHDDRDTARIRRLGAAGGTTRADLNHVTLAPGGQHAPPHCHALVEELFVVLDGAGTLQLGDETHPLRAGDLVARPPGTGVAHSLVAGDAGMTYLVFGTRVDGDSVYYPQTGKVLLTGLGVTIDVP